MRYWNWLKLIKNTSDSHLWLSGRRLYKGIFFLWSVSAPKFNDNWLLLETLLVKENCKISSLINITGWEHLETQRAKLNTEQWRPLKSHEHESARGWINTEQSTFNQILGVTPKIYTTSPLGLLVPFSEGEQEILINVLTVWNNRKITWNNITDNMK